MEYEESPKDRLECTEGKTFLTDEDIANIIDFHHEYPDMSLLNL